MILSILLLFLSLECSHNLIIEKTLDETIWTFVGKFCFVTVDKPTFSNFQYEITYPKEYYDEGVRVRLLFYTYSSWKDAYANRKTMSCSQNIATYLKGNNQFLSIEEYGNGFSLCRPADDKRYCQGNIKFETTSPRWWFIVLSTCALGARELEKDIKNFKLKFTMVNAEKGDILFRHFSVNEFYLPHIFILFFVIYLIFIALVLYSAYKLSSKKIMHYTFKVYMSAVFLQFLYLFFSLIAYLTYSRSGKMSQPLRTFARLIEGSSTLVLIVLLIVLAKGVTITRLRLKNISVKLLIAFTVLYGICYIVIIVYIYAIYDAAKSFYFYENVGGYILLFLRIIAFIWFLYAISYTMKHYPEKQLFYSIFLICYGVWFVAMPCVIIINTHLIPQHLREKIAIGVELTCAVISHLIILILTWPSEYNKNFPYHLRTNKISLIQVTSPNDKINLTSKQKRELAQRLKDDLRNTQPDPKLMEQIICICCSCPKRCRKKADDIQSDDEDEISEDLPPLLDKEKDFIYPFPHFSSNEALENPAKYAFSKKDVDKVLQLTTMHYDPNAEKKTENRIDKIRSAKSVHKLPKLPIQQKPPLPVVKSNKNNQKFNFSRTQVTDRNKRKLNNNNRNNNNNNNNMNNNHSTNSLEKKTKTMEDIGKTKVDLKEIDASSLPTNDSHHVSSTTLREMSKTSNKSNNHPLSNRSSRSDCRKNSQKEMLIENKKSLKKESILDITIVDSEESEGDECFIVTDA
ncbi:hypothetical protein SNEBB_003946 [Seison nebaliae]|nr:hypothetical protein SNEBB_003946 [Seison nebaliae]